MIDVAETIKCDGHLLAVIELHYGALRVNQFDRGEFAVRDAKGAVRRAELNSISSCEHSLSSRKTSTPNRRTGLYSTKRPSGALTVSMLASRSTALTRT